jgi:hypothetical protein
VSVVDRESAAESLGEAPSGWEVESMAASDGPWVFEELHPALSARMVVAHSSLVRTVQG